MFSEIPKRYLRVIAVKLTEVKVDAGETIFEKGDPGDCLYIIIDGKVNVHDGEMVVNTLGKLEFFGEMAALDPEARSASVTAQEATSLFRLDREALSGLMAEHPVIAQNIIHILSQRLRARMRDMVDDFQYIQQFERVISAAVAVESGIYEPSSLNEVAQRTDELGRLARVFQQMAKEVYLREERLKREVAELRIEIDEATQARQVSEITDSDYFQDLKLKVKQLRSGQQGPSKKRADT